MGKENKKTRPSWKKLFKKSVQDTVNLHMEVLALRDRIKNLEEDKQSLTEEINKLHHEARMKNLSDLLTPGWEKADILSIAPEAE